MKKGYVIMSVAIDIPTSINEGIYDGVAYGLAVPNVYLTRESAEKARDEEMAKQQAELLDYYKEEYQEDCDRFFVEIEDGVGTEKEVNVYETVSLGRCHEVANTEVVNTTIYRIEEVNLD